MARKCNPKRFDRTKLKFNRIISEHIVSHLRVPFCREPVGKRTVFGYFLLALLCIVAFFFALAASIYYCIKRILCNLIVPVRLSTTLPVLRRMFDIAINNGSNMRLMECLHTLDPSWRRRKVQKNGTKKIAGDRKRNAAAFLFSCSPLDIGWQCDSMLEDYIICPGVCVCHATLSLNMPELPFAKEESTIYVYLIKRWVAPANGIWCQCICNTLPSIAM